MVLDPIVALNSALPARPPADGPARRAGVVQALEIPAEGLRNVRFGWSMVTEATLSLWAAAGDDQAPWVRRWWSDVRGRLPPGRPRLLREIIGTGGYPPDFLLPVVAGGSTSLDEELHALVTTSTGSIRDDLTCAIADAKRTGRTGPALPLATRLLDARGEGAYLAALADELRTYWAAALAPYWDGLRADLELEFDHRARTLAADGVQTVIADMSRHLAWSGDTLLVDMPPRARLTANAGLWCVGSAFMGDRILLTSRPDDTVAIYFAVGAAGATSGRQPIRLISRDLTELLGATRAALLATLDIVHTTADLARRHNLSAATVSHHLGILHKAGLLHRRRDGKRVLYRRSPLGNALTRRKISQ
ncbi:helix-turn-helix domain-containing protein [Micromonospora sp. NBC_01699]|uniref:ArsR/SmtB family transcription factor n=1 Tax=Micromonospora sp. NBC_01699 TaxID=2975984 RepID=UPI002E2ABEB3|nr:helix-turn-helix domain-containing protein [Micromonospora sp. NBC_01699]